MLPDGSLATINIGLSPNVFSVGSLEITWHAVFMVVATAAAVYLVTRWADDAGLREEIVPEVAIWAVLGGIIGARALNVVDDWGFYKSDPSQIFRIWEGGIAIFGAFAGGLFAGMAYAFWRGYPIRYLMDLAGPTLILAQAIGRIGDIINGEHFSTQTSLPWAIVYTHSASPGFGRPPTHPAVAYELLADLFVFGVLLMLRGRLAPRGTMFALTAAIYGGIRLGFSFIRLDSASDILGLNQQGFIGAVVLGLGLLWLVALRVRLGQRDFSPPPQFAADHAPAA